MTDQDETVAARLKRLTDATQGLRARPGFTDRVMLAVQATSTPGWLESVALTARAGFTVAALAVVAAVLLALQTDQTATEVSAAAYTAVGIDW